MTSSTSTCQQLVQRRRRRARANQANCRTGSPSTLIVSSLILLLIAALDRATARQFLNPVAVGLRSALASRTGTQTKTSSWDLKRSLTQKAQLVSSNEDNEDGNYIEDAFFRASSTLDVQRMREVRYAFRPKRKVPLVADDADELDYLESLTIPCSIRSTTAVPGATSSISTASTTFAASTDASAASSRGGAVAMRPLAFWESMICGAVSRSMAQTIMHPANTMKTMLQNSRGGPGAPTIATLLRPESFHRLTQGAGANFLLSVPHGAVNFAVLELVRRRMGIIVEATPVLKERAESMGAGLDFLSSAISTITCSIVSTPQMMITDNIMAGNYPNLPSAISGLAQNRGIAGFYTGWWPGLVGKIPSYALTWTLFQQLKVARDKLSDRPANNVENSIMGCLASGTTVCIMIPIDTIKTRLVTQGGNKAMEGAYKGIIDCAIRVAREEGMATFYRGLPPRLVSVVPMIGIQFGVYEFMKRAMLQRQVGPDVAKPPKTKQQIPDLFGSLEILQEAAMEVAASPEHPYPAPRFVQRAQKDFGKRLKKKIQKARKVPIK